MFMGRDLGCRACCQGLGGTDLFKGFMGYGIRV